MEGVYFLALKMVCFLFVVQWEEEVFLEPEGKGRFLSFSVVLLGGFHFLLSQVKICVFFFLRGRVYNYVLPNEAFHFLLF